MNENINGENNQKPSTFAKPIEEMKQNVQPTPSQQQFANPNHSVPGMNRSVKSHFSGTMFEYCGSKFLGIFLTVITLGICLPWYFTIMFSYECKNTYINGRKLYFDGKGSEFLGTWLLCMLFMTLSFGIYGLWVPAKIQKWKAEHTHFEDETTIGNSDFDGKALSLIGNFLLSLLIIMVSFGIAFPWAYVRYKKWILKHTLFDGYRLEFVGKGGKLFGNFIKWVVLTIITFGIYGLWVSVFQTAWEVKNTNLTVDANAKIVVQNRPSTLTKPNKNGSYFTGTAGELFGYISIGAFFSLLTCGIMTSWIFVYIFKWKYKNTVIGGKRLKFMGTGSQLFVKNIIWGLLIGITFGIFFLWVPLKMIKWVVEYIRLENGNPVIEDCSYSKFRGGFFQFWLRYFGVFFIVVFTFGICIPWAINMMFKWLYNNSIYDLNRVGYNGKGSQLFGKFIIWYLLCIVTFGVYSIFIYEKILCWLTKHVYFKDQVDFYSLNPSHIKSQPNYNSGYNQPNNQGYGQPNYNPAYNQPNYNQPNYNPGYNQPSYNQPNYNPGYNQPNYNPGYNQPNYNQPNYNQPNYSQPNYNPGYNQPNYKPGYNQPNYNPGYNQTNYNQPNYSQPNYNPTYTQPNYNQGQPNYNQGQPNYNQGYHQPNNAGYVQQNGVQPSGLNINDKRPENPAKIEHPQQPLPPKPQQSSQTNPNDNH